jgi:hypothetical protein
MGLEPGLEVEASAVTASGTAPDAGVTVSAAVGGAATLITLLAEDVAPAVSLTVTVIVKLPALV